MKIRKDLKMPKWLVSRVERKAKAQGSSFSQFMRTAAIEKLERDKKVA